VSNDIRTALERNRGFAAAFEREFAAYVAACERVCEGALVAVSAALRPATQALASA